LSKTQCGIRSCNHKEHTEKKEIDIRHEHQQVVRERMNSGTIPNEKWLEEGWERRMEDALIH
jgi:hypothetical protein